MLKNLKKFQGSILLAMLIVVMIIAVLYYGVKFWGTDEKQGQVEKYQDTLQEVNQFKLEYDEAQRKQLEMLEE